MSRWRQSPCPPGRDRLMLGSETKLARGSGGHDWHPARPGGDCHASSPPDGTSGTDRNGRTGAGGLQRLGAVERCHCWQRRGPGSRSRQDRSEEHTSELQSRRDLVCRLLLEKKKTNRTASTPTTTPPNTPDPPS